MRRAIIIAVLLVSAGTATAQTVATNVPLTTTLSFDLLHDRIARDIDRTVDYFDTFFGTDNLNDDNRATHLTLRLGVRYDRLQQATLGQDFDLRLSLPQLRNRFQIIVDDAIDVGSLNDSAAYESSLQGAKPDTGLRYIFTDTDRIRLNLDAGVQLGTPLRFFTKLRGRYTIDLDPWQIRFTERLLYYTRDGAGEDTETEISRRLDNGTLYRARTVVQWREADRGITPRISLSRFSALDAKSSWRTALRASWAETFHGGTATYGHEVTYRRLIHSNWLFLELTPGIEWRERNDFGWNPFIALTLEINFNAGEDAKR